MSGGRTVRSEAGVPALVDEIVFQPLTHRHHFSDRSTPAARRRPWPAAGRHEWSRSGDPAPMPVEMRVVVIDEHPLFVSGLELLLPRVSDGRAVVVGATSDASAAAATVRSAAADLALVDLHLPPPGGLAAVASIHREVPRVRVVAMCRDEEGEDALSALRAGADGLLPRTAHPGALLPPLLAVLQGLTVMPSAVLGSLITRPAGRPAPAPLDDQERSLLRLISAGRTTVSMAVHLHVSERTTKRLVAALLRKLRVTNRAEAAAVAGRSGLL